MALFCSSGTVLDVGWACVKRMLQDHAIDWLQIYLVSYHIIRLTYQSIYSHIQVIYSLYQSQYMQYYTDLYSTFVQAFANPPSLESNRANNLMSYRGLRLWDKPKRSKRIQMDTVTYSLTTCTSSYKFNVQVPTKTRIPQDIFRILCRYALPAYSW